MSSSHQFSDEPPAGRHAIISSSAIEERIRKHPSAFANVSNQGSEELKLMSRTNREDFLVALEVDPSAITPATSTGNSRPLTRVRSTPKHPCLSRRRSGRRLALQVMAGSLVATAARRSMVVSAWGVSSLARASRARRTSRASGRELLTTHQLQARRPSTSMAGSKSDNADQDATKRKNKKTSTKKLKVVDKIEQHHLDKLSKAFDDLARKEGLDSEHAFFADDADFVDEEDDDEDIDFAVFDDDGDENDIVEDIERDRASNEDFDDDSMEARIASAARERDSGKVAVPWELDELATSRALGRLGFQREANPFGDDETPRKERFATLLRSPLTCPACGSKFQCDDEARPGFLPREKYEIQVSLSKLEEVQAVQLKAESDDLEWSPEDEVEWLLQQEQQRQEQQKQQTASGESIDSSQLPTAELNLESMAQDLDLDLVELSQQKPAICRRCHGLQNFGKIDDALRPGWTSEPTLSQEKFRNLLRPLRDKPAVIVALVDLFDFAGSVLPELDSIAGDNPVILAANKVDLLPDKMGPTRVESWVRRELEYLGVRSLANIGGAVRLVSCKTGQGVAAMMGKARALADEMDCDIYVVGAANAGKSTLLNHLLAPSRTEDRKVSGKRRAGNANKKRGEITTSPLPGTTLEFIKVDLGDGRNLYDTPGLLVPGTLTQILTPDELKVVVPRKQVEPVTFRVAQGKCVLVGGLARVELADGKPFLFTFFVANDVKLHPTDASRAGDVLRRHAGEMITPPFGADRLDQILGDMEEHVIEVQGAGWREAAADISLTGLGWVTVTGAGTAKVRVSVPRGVAVALRPPLMPYDVWETTAKFTGSRAVRRSTKLASGKRRKGVGRS